MYPIKVPSEESLTFSEWHSLKAKFQLYYNFVSFKAY